MSSPKSASFIGDLATIPRFHRYPGYQDRALAAASSPKSASFTDTSDREDLATAYRSQQRPSYQDRTPGGEIIP